MLARQLDHLVLTVEDIEITCLFYASVLGLRVVETGVGRRSLVFGTQKINLHRKGREFTPHALHPTSGSADLCFLTDMPMEGIVNHLTENDVEIIDGPVQRDGAAGPLHSLYFRDPDGNLIELANQLSTSTPDQDDAA